MASHQCFFTPINDLNASALYAKHGDFPGNETGMRMDIGIALRMVLSDVLQTAPFWHVPAFAAYALDKHGTPAYLDGMPVSDVVACSGLIPAFDEPGAFEKKQIVVDRLLC